MARIIRNARVEDDAWQTLRLEADAALQTLPLPEAPFLAPLALWQARKAELLARGGPHGVWLAGDEAPAALADDLAQLQVIALDFPKFTDGRAYSSARLLRERYAYRGELRAIGDVLHDQLFYMQRCGFDAFALRADKDPHAALAGLRVFSERYQAAADEPLPLFRRRTTQVTP